MRGGWRAAWPMAGAALVLAAAATCEGGAPRANPLGRFEAQAELRDPRALMSAIERSFALVEDYRCRAILDVAKGSKRTHREGTFYFRRPHQVLLKAGPVGIVFRKDGSIRGWLVTRLLSHGHGPDDEALYDARGKRYDRYALADVIAEARTLVEAAASTEVVVPPGGALPSLVVVPPAGGPLSRRVYTIDPVLLLPVGWSSFEGSIEVESVSCGELAVNTGLTDELFR